MPAQTHTYLRTHTLAGALLTADLKRESAALLEKAAASTAKRAAKTLFKQGPLRVTMVAMQAGGSLQKHLVQGEVTVQMISGRARLDTNGRAVDLVAGTLVSLGAGVQHDLIVSRDCVVLLTMLLEEAA